jgi:Flp pilus assembly protein TadD
VAAFSRAVSADPDFSYPHDLLGRAYLVQGAMAGAISESRVAIALNPSAWTAHLVLGKALDATGAGAEAQEELKKGRDLKPSEKLSPAEKNLLKTSYGQENK